MRLAALYSHPSQYAVPLFRELSRRPGIDFTAYFLSRQGIDESYDPGFGKSFSWDLPMLDGYRSSFLPNLRSGHSVNGFFRLLNVSVVEELRKNRYDALLVHGYEHFAKWLAFFGAKLGGTRLILRGESNLIPNRGWGVRFAKQTIFGELFKGFHSFAYIGSLNRRYYESYGVDSVRLFFAPYSVDNDFFGAEALRLRPRREDLRQEFGVRDDGPIILFAGKLCERKQPELLLKAFAGVRKDQKCHLLYAGDGELRNPLERMVRENGVPDVHFAGFLNQSELPRAYAAADIFVLPSVFETWGLVVNEAMASGLPVIAAEGVGCASDLIREKENGYVVPDQDIEAMADRIAVLVANGDLRSAFGAKSRERIKDWSIGKTADGIIEAAIAKQPCP